MTETTPPTPPAQPATPGQPAGAPDARPAPGVHHPIPGQMPPPGYPVPVGYRPVPPGYQPPRYVPVPVGPDGRPLAGFGDRLVAFIVDAVLMSLVGLVFTVPLLIWWFRLFAENVTTFSNSVDPNEEIPPDAFGRFFGELLLGYLVLFAVAVAIGLALSYVYLVEMSWKGGQTFGKRIMKLEIIPAVPGEQRTRKMFVRRWAVERVAGSLIPFFSWVDGLWQLGDKPLQQCLHDKAARTVVVKIG